MQDTLLRDVGISILGAAALSLPATFLRLPLILAYLGAGILLGPHLGFGVIHNSENISTLSEIGLVLLMFILGLEIDPRKLLSAGKAVFFSAISQFVGCLLLALFFFQLFGYSWGQSKFTLVYLAVAASLSSTLVVVKVLSDRMELDTLTARISLGVLVIQDLWAIGFLAIQPSLSNLEAGVLLTSMGKAAALVAIAFAVSKLVLPFVFKKIAKQPELVIVTSMAWCFAMCGLAHEFKLSLEMGALVAGVAIASLPYHMEIIAKVTSLRDFFITLFFVALGLQIPKPTLFVVLLTSGLVFFSLFSRVLTIFPTLYLLKYGNRTSLIPALNISNISEFSLVLATLGITYGHIPTDILSALVLSLVVTILFSSLGLIPRSYEIYCWVAPYLKRLGFRDHADSSVEVPKDFAKIILLGFYREASSLLADLQKEAIVDGHRDLLVIDYNPEVLKKLKASGVRAAYGDISHVDTLTSLGIDKAQTVICTIPDQILKGTTNLKLVEWVKKSAPSAQVIATAENLQIAIKMYEAGASYVMLPRLVSASFLCETLKKIQAGNGKELRDVSLAHLQDRKEILP